MSRYAGRADYYARNRPTYPAGVISLLAEAGFLFPGAVLADIGSGTGKLAELFLREGYTVHAVEPDPAMREAASRGLAAFPGYHLLPGSAEATGLADACVDLIIVGQAFHWFDPVPARAEFLRISRPPHRLATVDNRPTPDSVWMEVRENLRRHETNPVMSVLNERNPENARGSFFTSHTFRVFPNDHYFDFEGLVGRVLSLSNKPMPGQPGYDAMLADLRAIFDRRQQAGRIQVKFETRLYYGNL